MAYEEKRWVILPDGRPTQEVRCQDDDGTVRYRYGLDLSGMDVEYNGQVLGAVEPDNNELDVPSSSC